MENYKTQKAEIGDIIQSPQFAYAIADHKHEWDDTEERYVVNINDKKLTIDGQKDKEHIIQFLDHYDRKGTPIHQDVDVAAYKPGREFAKFVVEKANYQGGTMRGHGFSDIYPDGWHIKAKELTPQGQYDENGATIEFYQTGSFTNKVEEVTVVGKAKMTIDAFV